MKRISGPFIFLLVSVTLYSCFPGKEAGRTTNIRPVSSDTIGIMEGSLIYALPRTVFTVKVEAERTIMIPGPYGDYAEDMLGLKDVVKTRKEHWSICGLSVYSHEEADPSEYYVIHSTGVFISNVLALKKEGVILDFNAAVGYPTGNIAENGGINSDNFISSDLGSDEYYLVQTDTAYRRVKVDSSFIRIPYIVEKKKKLSQDQLAERAAKRLMELRDGKVQILTGEANVFPQSDASIIEINRMEKEYTELFTGKYISDKRIFTYQFIPMIDSTGKPIQIFRFSEETGPSDAGSPSGVPVMAEVVPEQKTKDIVIFDRGIKERTDAKLDKLFYRIPDIANIKISMNGKALYNSRKLVYQLGEVMQLPSNYVIGR
jgi:hypothetical protein